eukprot:GHRQ01031824.1.p2 GENE.GHRQ01031824.1~~GHRQ01031824.1.p2  ORF type:complete len:122 (-),score=47.12 GHRQ01031824.1:316-681(-)
MVTPGKPAVPHLFCSTLWAVLHHRYFTKVMSDAADRHCSGRLLFFHEGGYSAAYVPFCGLAVLEQLSGHKTQMQDVLLGDTAVGGQALQPWQEAVVQQVEAGPLALLRQKMVEPSQDVAAQ